MSASVANRASHSFVHRSLCMVQGSFSYQNQDQLRTLPYPERTDLKRLLGYTLTLEHLY